MTRQVVAIGRVFGLGLSVALTSAVFLTCANARTDTASQAAGNDGADLKGAGRALDEGLRALANGEYALARSRLQSAYETRRRLLGATDAQTLLAENDLAAALVYLGQYETAEALYRELYSEESQRPGSDDAALAALGNLAAAIQNQGAARWSEAEKLDRQVYAARLARNGPESTLTRKAMNNLATVLLNEKRPQDAELLLRPLYQARLEAGGIDDTATLATLVRLASVLRAERRFDEAADGYRAACAKLSEKNLTLETPQAAGVAAAAAACNANLALNLRDLSDSRGGDAAYLSEAFVAAQRAVPSSETNGMSRENARAFAVAHGAGVLANEYEDDVEKKAALERQLEAQDATGGAAAEELAAELNRLRDRIAMLDQQLNADAPLYRDYRSPQPLTIAALQARQGEDAALLREDEAVIFWLAPAGSDSGLVFAVSKERAGWARLPASWSALSFDMRTLRSEIDARALAATTGHAVSGPAFDLGIASRLYRELLGDNAIQSVIAGKPILLFVHAAPFTSLPPSVLVAGLPPRSGTGAQALRDANWLIRQKSIAILPAVSSLAVLREHLAEGGRQPAVPLVAFADPDFRGSGSQSRGTLDAWFTSLSSLPGTRAEAQALQQILHGAPADVHLGPEVSKTVFLSLARDGRLGEAKVLEFATHGFPPGTIPGVPEATLALAHPGAGADASDDGLLRASEIARLKLHAEWVLLSACDSAAGAEGAGISALPDAFFYAGARSVLVSHWRLRDDAATRLVTAMFRVRQGDPAMTKAEALRRSMLELMDDKSLDSTPSSFADPSAWAPFVIVGEER